MQLNRKQKTIHIKQKIFTKTPDSRKKMIENSPTNIHFLNQDDFITKKIPKFILIKIFSYLSINAIGKVAQTCKKLKAISEKEFEEIKKFPFKIEEIRENTLKKYKEIKLSYFGYEKFGIIGAECLTEKETTHEYLRMNISLIKNNSNFLHFKMYEGEEIKEKSEIIFYNFTSIWDFDHLEEKIILKYSPENKNLALKRVDGFYFPPYINSNKKRKIEKANN